jgi:hypothetical protein
MFKNFVKLEAVTGEGSYRFLESTLHGSVANTVVCHWVCLCPYLQFHINFTPTSVPSVKVGLFMSVDPPPPGLEMSNQSLLIPIQQFSL